MPSTVESLAPAHQIIEVVHSGEVSAADLRVVEKRIAELAQESGIRLLLGNYLEATGLPGAIDVLNLVEAAIGAFTVANGKHALLWPKNDQARIELDVARMAEKNNGVNMRIFGDRDAAIAWLES
ncbi:MAG: hypothetical protein GC156_16450 [Actinomycetales bacterium]|nr:hypothetical protein [Actinomycetales bacterium]